MLCNNFYFKKSVGNDFVLCTHLRDSYYATHTYDYYNMSVNLLPEFYFVLNKVPMRDSSHYSWIIDRTSNCIEKDVYYRHIFP